MADNVLNSWKEIAAYLGRGVRTVQRWEQELHLPVRRPQNRERSAVMGLRSDLDEWMACTPILKKGFALPSDPEAANRIVEKRLENLRKEVKQMEDLLRSLRLRTNSRASKAG